MRNDGRWLLAAGAITNATTTTNGNDDLAKNGKLFPTATDVRCLHTDFFSFDRFSFALLFLHLHSSISTISISFVLLAPIPLATVSHHLHLCIVLSLCHAVVVFRLLAIGIGPFHSLGHLSCRASKTDAITLLVAAVIFKATFMQAYRLHTYIYSHHGGGLTKAAESFIS